MDKVNKSSRKARRLESKKKKAAAFLNLLDHKMENPVCGETAPQGSDNEPPNNDVITEMKKIVRERKKQAMMVNPVYSETAPPESDNEPLSNDVITEMNQIVREQKKQAMQKPKVFLTLEAMLQFRAVPDEPVKEEELPPLYVMDLQQLLLYGLQGNSASYKPRWCKLLRVGKVSSVVLLMLEGISYNDYEKYKSNFPFTSEKFVRCVEVVCPKQYKKTVDEELYSVPLSVSQLKKVNVRVPKSVRDTVVAKIGQTVGKAGSEKLSRTCLLLSTYQMMLEGYPLPIHTNIGRYRDFVFTKDTYVKVTANSPVFAIDCEMCTTSIMKNELTRVSVVSENGEVIYDTLVKPKNKIINYLTRFSGITKQMLDPVETMLEDVQREIQNILPGDAILCGQSLNGDLIALKDGSEVRALYNQFSSIFSRFYGINPVGYIYDKPSTLELMLLEMDIHLFRCRCVLLMFHPYVIDTSVIFNMSGNRGVKAGLRKLSQFFLGRSIQDSKHGHSSAEDASATLDLVKLKLTKGLEFGDATLSGVYFPDIHTYFMSGDSGAAGVIQNVEQDAKEDVVQKPEDSSESACGLSTRKASSDADILPSVADKEGEHSAFIHRNGKRDSSGLNITHTGIMNKKVSSTSSSSSADESDDGEETKTDFDSGASSAKKCKLDEPLNTKSGSSLNNEGSDTPSCNHSKPQAGDSNSDGLQCDSIVKCKDFSFASTTELVEQQKQCLFSQENSVHISHSFFRLVYEAGRPGCIIDREAVICKYMSEPIETAVAATDSEVRRTAKAMVQSKQFVWAHFRGYSDERELASQQRKEKLMRKLDHRVHSIMNNVKPNALVVLVMTGRDSDDIPQNMAAFITTT